MSTDLSPSTPRIGERACILAPRGSAPRVNLVFLFLTERVKSLPRWIRGSTRPFMSVNLPRLPKGKINPSDRFVFSTFSRGFNDCVEFVIDAAGKRWPMYFSWMILKDYPKRGGGRNGVYNTFKDACRWFFLFMNFNASNK